MKSKLDTEALMDQIAHERWKAAVFVSVTKDWLSKCPQQHTREDKKNGV